MLLRMLAAAVAVENLGIHRRPTPAALILHKLELLRLLRFFIFFHQGAEEVFIVSRRFWNVDSCGRGIEFLSVVRTGVRGCASIFGEVAAKAGTAGGANFD